MVLALKLIVFTFAISTGVLGRDTRRGSIRHRQAGDEYKFNHPPVPENYEAIPVAVVYENESNREEKSLKNNTTPEHNTDEVSKVPFKSESSEIKESSSTEVNNNNELEIKKSTNTEENESKVTTYRPQKEHQIPVAVVYEPEPTYYQNTRTNRNRTTNKRRRPQKPVLEDEDKEDNYGSSEHTVAHVNGHTGPGLLPSSNKRVESNKRRNSVTPVTEKQDIVRGSTPSDPTSGKVDKPNKTQNIQELVTVEAEIPSKNNIILKPTLNNQEPLHKKEKLQPLKDEIKIKVENEKPLSSRESEIDANKKLEQVTADIPQQLRKRDNSTRVREVIPIVQSENIVFSHSGNFKYSYEGGDGTKAFEAGELKTFDDETAGEAVSGGFSYTAKDGNEYSLSYTADENGYRPVGAHLPTPPPIPPAIARALAYLATKTTPEPVTESIADKDQ